ncbi:hypothetical protein PMAYCL1PPCAC_21268, partial [Pristionchus mayeri]
SWGYFNPQDPAAQLHMLPGNMGNNPLLMGGGQMMPSTSGGCMPPTAWPTQHDLHQQLQQQAVAASPIFPELPPEVRAFRHIMPLEHRTASFESHRSISGHPHRLPARRTFS